jgi:hypothetical protein
LYSNETFCLIEHPVHTQPEHKFLPRIDNYSYRIITSIDEANELLRDGYDIFSLPFSETLDRLKHGAIAFCVLVGKDVAHVGWLGLTEEAKNTFDPHPFKVDFSRGEACAGGTMTAPQYEGLGLMGFGYYLRFEYLMRKGFFTLKSSVDANNLASQKVHAKFDARTYGTLSHRRILFMNFWRESVPS